MTPYTAHIKKQGYLVKEIALLRGVTVGQMSNISKSPTQWDWLALKGLGMKERRLIDLTYAELLDGSVLITENEKTELRALCAGIVVGDKREE